MASKTADNATRLAAIWHLNESLRFFGKLKLTQLQKDVLELDGWLIKRCLKEQTTIIPTRDIKRYVSPKNLRKTEYLKSVLSILGEANRALVFSCGSSTEIHVNPSPAGR